MTDSEFDSELAMNEIIEGVKNVTFTKTKSYDPPHEYIVCQKQTTPENMELWFKVRRLSEKQGVVRKFFKSPLDWKYLDLPDGYTYWVMAQWLQPNWRAKFQPYDTYILNRQDTKVAKSGEWTK